MSIFQSLILGIVQGLTEFLPISSSGHLIIFPNVFGWAQQPLVFDTTLHLGTAAALIVFFRKDLFSIAKAVVFDLPKNPKMYSPLTKVGLAIVVGIIPAGVVGFLYGDFLENTFRSVQSVSLFLVLGSVLMFIAEKVLQKRNNQADKISVMKGFIIGLFQTLALLPGMSRSGSTISGGMILGLDREASTRFSFLLSVPIVVLAAFYQLFKARGEITAGVELSMLIGFTTSFISGILAIGWLLKFVKNKNLYPFIIYRIILAVLLLVLI